MTKAIASLVLAFLLGLSLCPFFLMGQGYNVKLEKQQLKARQKEERRELKLREKYRKESLKSQLIPKAMRTQAKHQMSREARQLHEKQKDERQQLKDEQRSLKESQKNLQDWYHLGPK